MGKGEKKLEVNCGVQKFEGEVKKQNKTDLTAFLSSYFSQSHWQRESGWVGVGGILHPLFSTSRTSYRQIGGVWLCFYTSEPLVAR